MPFEPWIRRDLFRTLDVVFGEIDLHGVAEIALLVVLRTNPQELGVRDREARRFERQGNRSLLDDAVDVVPPRVGVEDADDGKPEFLVESLEEAATSAGRLPRPVSQDAVVLLPEAIFVEAIPHRAFFDVQHELRLAFPELNHVRFDDGGKRVAARAHATAVDLIAFVDERDVADHRPAVFGEHVEFFAKRSERHFEVFEDRVGLVLRVEGVLLRPRDRVLRLVEHATKARRLLRFDQFLDRRRVQHRLHELLGGLEIEQRALARSFAHLEDAALLVPVRVGTRAGRNLEDGIASGEDLARDLFGERVDLLLRRLVAFAAALGRVGVDGHRESLVRSG